MRGSFRYGKPLVRKGLKGMETENGSGMTITGMEGYAKKLDKLKTTDPELARMLTDAIRRAIRGVRDELAKEAKSGLKMESDPRQAVRAIRHTVYRRLFGGNVNILQGKSARGNVTADALGKRKYFGKERGFVLRFLNQGTRERFVGFRNNKYHVVQYEAAKKYGLGKRGSIQSRTWFGGASTSELEKMAGKLDEYINEVILKMMD